MTSPAPKKQPVTGRTRSAVIAIDRFIYWLARHWVAAFTVAAGIYVGLPILAPVFMNAGATNIAKGLYVAYSPMCHQMASRSFFLFGEQPFYPRAIAEVAGYKPIEDYMGDIPEFAGISNDPAQWNRFLLPARTFLGNEQMGYKMALCERDIAIYGVVFLASLAYGLLHRRFKIKPLPFIAFVIIGMGPISLDGFSQLFSQFATAYPSLTFLQQFLTLRESTPLIRALTGALFGFGLVWMSYPHIDKSMEETVNELGAKLRKAGVLP